jgi:hypothetical protein
MRKRDGASIWVPGLQMSGGRSMLPSDIRGEQSDVLEAILPGIRPPALRARLATSSYGPTISGRAIGLNDHHHGDGASQGTSADQAV